MRRVVCCSGRNADDRGDDDEEDGDTSGEEHQLSGAGARGIICRAGSGSGGRRAAEGARRRTAMAKRDYRNPMFHTPSAKAERAIARSVIGSRLSLNYRP